MGAELGNTPGTRNAPAHPLAFSFQVPVRPPIFRESGFKVPLTCWAWEGAVGQRVSGLHGALMTAAEVRLSERRVRDGACTTCTPFHVCGRNVGCWFPENGSCLVSGCPGPESSSETPPVLWSGFLSGKITLTERFPLKSFCCGDRGAGGVGGSQSRPPAKAWPPHTASGASGSVMGRLESRGGQTPGGAPLPIPFPWQPGKAESEKLTEGASADLPYLLVRHGRPL